VAKPVIRHGPFSAPAGLAGDEPDRGAIVDANEAVGDAVPVLMNTGARADNIGASWKWPMG
jgi:predicted TIM-barrel enzyme